MRARLIGPILGLLALGSAWSASAESFPDRPITMIVPLAAGGPTDTLARILAEAMRSSLGQPVVVENVTGGAGTTGIVKAVRAEPDGYTVVIGNWFTHVVNSAIYPDRINPVRDFEPVSLVGDNPLLIVAKKGVPANNLSELISWLKTNAGTASEGTSGAGSASHIAGVLFQQATGTHFQFVPYRGAAPAMHDLVGGQIELMFDQVSSSLPYVRADQIRAYAVTAKTRATIALDIPTVDEAGLPGFHVSVWHAIWAPKNTPAERIRKLNAAVADALRSPSVRARLAELGQELPSQDRQTPQALATHQRTEMDKWWPIVKAANIKAN